jgi:hypothetical protein
VGQPHLSVACRHVALVQQRHPTDLFLQILDQAIGQGDDPVPAALPVPDQNAAIAEVDVFDAQANAFHQPEARTVQEGGHQPARTFELGQYLQDLLFGEHRR